MAERIPRLLVTYDVQNSESAKKRVSGVLQELGLHPAIMQAPTPGVFEVAVDADPHDILRQLRSMCERDPSLFAHTHHWRPVEAWIPTEVPSMTRAVGEVGRRIDPDETWRLTLETHGNARWHGKELVKPLTESVRHGYVKMDDPEKQIRVDILGDHAAVTLIERGEELSVDKVRDAEVRRPQDI